MSEVNVQNQKKVVQRKRFIEITKRHNGKKVLINVDNINEVSFSENGTFTDVG